MPIQMTQQQIAEWILEILVEELKLKPGDRLPDQLLVVPIFVRRLLVCRA